MLYTILCSLITSNELYLLFVGSSKHRRRQNYKGPVVVCFGEMMINLVPTVSRVSLADAAAYQKFPSGGTANVAVGISRLGGSTAFIGKVKFSNTILAMCSIYIFTLISFPYSCCCFYSARILYAKPYVCTFSWICFICMKQWMFEQPLINTLKK